MFSGSNPDYPKYCGLAAAELGRELAVQNCSLAYGGGSLGLMGEVARQAYNCGMESILAVVPEFMSQSLYNDASSGWGQVLVVPDMATRKAIIARNSDCFIALPGGFGTLDEITEMLTWNQIGYHSKAIGILNVEGYFDGILSWIDRAVQDGFIRQVFADNVIVSSNPVELLQKLLTHEVLEVPSKFLTKA